MSRILGAGSRELSDYGLVFQAVQHWSEIFPGATIIHGANERGADLFLQMSAVKLGLPFEKHPADWAKYGKKAGPIRNQEMVDLGADVVLVFRPHGISTRGTNDLAGRAYDAGLTVVSYWQEDPAYE